MKFHKQLKIQPINISNNNSMINNKIQIRINKSKILKIKI